MPDHILDNLFGVIKVYKSEFMAPNTMLVSTDVYDSLLKAMNDKAKSNNE